MLEHLNKGDYIKPRQGETKLGEDFIWLGRDWRDEMTSDQLKYVIVGVREDFGPRANLGKPGAKDFFDAFLTTWCNFQSNQFLNGKEVAVLGCVDFAKNLKISKSSTYSLSELRQGVEKMDEILWTILKDVYKQNKIPILVGGGHNNAFPLIKGAAVAFNNAIQALNFDAHSDFRNTQEGRHSGNSFSLAMESGFLDYYCVAGLHKNYNSQYLIDTMDAKKIATLYLEDIPIGASEEFLNQWIEVKLKSNRKLGIEIDMDGIENIKSSAQSPYGFSLRTMRNLIQYLAGDKRICYLNITEAIPDENNQSAKAASYLVGDFINRKT
ncbi:formimidoylglutamase [Luteibaculum oceani]|uniref:Formimidoylglutamase n=1 Tax=Luteibaculum oceani TaxID=1294296 RepID=A0A5C6V7W8_9FLAO|nr:formimidoylglutamase [Luteibaculum oceani]TXC81353.1 formimidoylglutamase [Luteibaculum oceani]